MIIDGAPSRISSIALWLLAMPYRVRKSVLLEHHVYLPEGLLTYSFNLLLGLRNCIHNLPLVHSNAKPFSRAAQPKNLLSACMEAAYPD